MKWVRTITNSTIFRVFLVTGIFIATTIIIGLYADRQIVDRRDSVSDTRALGSNTLDVERSVMRYDTNHYRLIVDTGYTSEETAFFPLFPLLVRGVHSLGISISHSLLAISWIFTFASAGVMYLWAKKELSIKKSTVSPWFILLIIAVFPTSLYLTIGYSESLFIFLTTSALYAYRCQRYWLAGLFAALSTATRVQGSVLMLFFLVDYLLDRKWNNWKKLIPFIIAPIGIGAYMLFLWQQFGNPLEFIAAQSHWGRFSGSPLENLLSSMTPPYIWYIPVLALMLFTVHKYLGKPWLVYTICFILLPLSSGRLDSLNRYMLAAPPLFLALAIWLESKPKFVTNVYFATSIFLLAWNIIFFFNDYWVA